MQNLLLTFAGETVWNSVLCVGRCQSVKYCEELGLIELSIRNPTMEEMIQGVVNNVEV